MKKCKEIGEVEEVSYPVPGRDVPTAFVTFQTHKEARKAISNLNGASYRGSTIEAVLLSRENKSVSSRTLRKSRLIVRNLSFKCTEEDIKQAFSSFGAIVEVHLPRKADGALMGYAFVQFASYFSAAKAVKGMNVHALKGRPVAVDWVVPKNRFEESMKQERGGGGGGGKGRESERTGERSHKTRGDIHEITHDFDSSVSDDKGLGEQEEEEDEEEEEEEDEKEEEEAEEEDGERKILTKGKEIHVPVKRDALEGKTVFIRLDTISVSVFRTNSKLVTIPYSQESAV